MTPNKIGLILRSKIVGLRSGNSTLWGFAEQALISAANFTLMVFLARRLGPSDFGAFIVAYTVLLFANSVQNALFTQPHNVLGVSKQGSQYLDYTGATALAQTIFSVGVGIVIVLAGVILLFFGNPHSGSMLLILGPISIIWQLQEFTRRILYTQINYLTTFINGLIMYSVQIAGVIVLWRTNHLNSRSALAVIGLASMIGLAAGVWKTNSSMNLRLKEGVFYSVTSQNWVYGRWLLGTQLAYWTSSQLYPILAAALIGTAASGGLRASQTLLGPTNILLKGVESMVPSRAAQVYATEGGTGLVQFMCRTVFPVATVMFSYCLLIAIFADLLVKVTMGERYLSYVWLVRVYAAYYGLALVISVGSITLRSMGVTSPLFVAQAMSALLALTCGIWGVYRFGIAGAAAGLIGSSVLVGVVLWARVYQELSRKKPVAVW